MSKKMSGLQWYKTVSKFLSSQKSYLIITQSDEQKLSLIDIINSHKGQGIILKAAYKKYGLYLSRGRRGDAAIVTQKVLDCFCNKNNIKDIDSCKYILRYTAKMFQESHQLKNINVHRNRKSPKYIPYYEQLEPTTIYLICLANIIVAGYLTLRGIKILLKWTLN